jgi:hypothetical protein
VVQFLSGNPPRRRRREMARRAKSTKAYLVNYNKCYKCNSE